jgi:RND superfamily putative drug exporter
LAIFVVHRRWWVIIGALVAVPLMGLYGGGVQKRLSNGGFEDPGAESAKAAAAIQHDFPASGQTDFVVVVGAKNGTVDDPSVAAEGERLTKQLSSEPGVLTATSYWSLGRVAQLASTNKHYALIVASFAGGEEQRLAKATALTPKFTIDQDNTKSLVTGRYAIEHQLAEQAQKDLERADTITAPLTFIALVAVFGGIVAALLPLGVAIIAVLGTFVALSVLSGFTDVSVFALNITTALGLGLSIDYSLFVVSRYREELQEGCSTPVAVGRAMQTAGRTVAFSAGTVAISLATLALFPIPYLRAFAYAGFLVVAFAAIGSIFVLPAILAALGPRVEKGRVYKAKERSDEEGFWYRQASRVMRHPAIYAIGVTTFLLLLAIPFFSFKPGQSDDRIGPKTLPARAATDIIRQNFDSREASALTVRIPSVDPASPQGKTELDRFSRALAVIPGVARIDTVNGEYLVGKDGTVAALPTLPSLTKRFEPAPGASGTYVSVVPTIEPPSAAGEQLVHHIRDTAAPFSFQVAGSSAQLVDTKAALFHRLPYAIILIALLTFVLLFMMTGSLLVPLKALGLNVLSLTATFGATVWLFQEGHFANTLHFTATGQLDVSTPILMFCIAFGLSMDYEVFLLSRIKEEYDLERDNERAVAIGLQKTGRIVTAAALLLTVVFLGVATSDVTLVKAMGIGMTIAVLVDAFLIRATLVPAFMRLAGRANWWAPTWLRRWHLRYGIWENEPIALLDRQFEATVT